LLLLDFTFVFYVHCHLHHTDPPSFPTRRSSDLLMRQDPDVILVGEIRDLETATIAIQAAMTGHLVLSTLHTNDAPSSITRLINIDRKSTRLNSSHVKISYAVFCLKKKKKNVIMT